jgi:hypothetical protein
VRLPEVGLGGLQLKEWLRWLVTGFVLVLIGSYAWSHRHQVATPAKSAEDFDSLPKYAEQKQAGEMVTYSGPLADAMLRQKPGDVVTLQPISSTVPQAGASSSVSYGPVSFDHATNDTPVGTSKALLHKTFNVENIVNLPFELPAHASTPNLRGTYRAFPQHNGNSQTGSDEDAAVEFMLLNQQQFADLLNGRPGDALFSADAASNGEVNFTMPPTFAQPAKYYLVFRNSAFRSGSRATGKAVQADFRIDF